MTAEGIFYPYLFRKEVNDIKEYDTIILDIDDDFAKELNKMAEEGWSLVSTVRSPNGYRVICILERTKSVG